ncbi:MAG: hypothetical protein QOJ76_296 [Acidobacteriota bacterium]|nr:hypothetical protein [Acidobacteriota bacterium]
MIKKTERLNPEQLSQVSALEGGRVAETVAGKKPFVEPEVTFPVDVLEATTFFQLADSGATT